MVALFLTEDGSDDEGLLLAMAAMDSNINDEYQISTGTYDIDDDDACYRLSIEIGNRNRLLEHIMVGYWREPPDIWRESFGLRILIGIVPIGRFCSEHFHGIRPIGKC